MNIAPYTPHQVEAWVRLMNLVRPVPISVSDFEAREAYWPNSDLRLRYLGTEALLPVVLGQVATAPYAPDDHLAAIISVDPMYTGKGLGTQMLAHLELESAVRGFNGLVATVREDANVTQAWVEARGFARFAQRFDSLLDLDTFNKHAHAATLKNATLLGLTFTDTTGVTEAQWQQVLELFCSLLLDTPDMEGLPPWSHERCRAVLRDNSAAPPEWIVVAWAADKPVGLTVGHWMGMEVYSYFTGVLPEWRGRNVGLALKLLLIEAARSQDIVSMRATNLDRNKPILRVNAALGFTKVSGTIEYRKQLSPS